MNPDGPKLEKAAKLGEIDVVRDILSQKTVPRAHKNRALKNACNNDDANMARLLLEHRANPNYQRVLREAAIHGYADICRELIKHGADTTLTGLDTENDMYHDYNGLQMALLRGHNEVARVFIEAKAHEHTKATIRIATMMSNIEMLNLLLERGADIHENNDDALSYAIYHNNPTIVELLLKAGADASSNKHYGIKEARAKERPEMIKMILRYYKSADLTKALMTYEVPRDLIKKEVQTRNLRAAQQTRKSEPEIAL